MPQFFRGAAYRARAHSGGKRARPAIFAEISLIVAIIVVSSAGFLRTTSSSDSSLVTASGCTAEQLEATPMNYTSVISSTRAASIANSSPNYTAAVSAMGPGVQVNYAGVAELENLVLSSCGSTFTNFEVAYALVNATNQTGQLSLWVNPTTGAVVNSTVQWMVGEEAHSYTSQWWGYTDAPCSSSCGLHATYTAWQNFGVSASSGHCGATYVSVGACIISPWGGLTATATGAGSARGIAQSGLNLVESCSWFIVYICSSGYVGWVELWPMQAAGINCIGVPSSSNLVASEVSWVAPSTYYATIWDQTTGASCTTTHTMAMGTPSYAQFISETSPTLTGGVFAIPVFNFNFNPAAALGVTANLSVYGSPIAYSSAITVQHPPSYNTGACAGTYLSCFNEY
jgi:hypothetical protein